MLVTMESMLSDPDRWIAPIPLPLPIETRRLVLRPFEHADAASMLDALDNDRNRLLPWIIWVRIENRSIPECNYSIERFRREREAPGCTSYALAIIDRETGAVLGGTGLHHIHPGLRDAEIGYWLRPDRHNQGLVTEATAALITAALTPQARSGWGLRRITIRCGADNAASAAVPRKLGMRLEVRARRERYVDGLGYHDMLGFAVLADEWDFLRGRARPGIGWDGQS